MQKFDLFGPSTLQHNTLTFNGGMSQDACTDPAAAGGRGALPALFDTAKTPVKQNQSTCLATVEAFSLGFPTHDDGTQASAMREAGWQQQQQQQEKEGRGGAAPYAIVDLTESYSGSAAGAAMKRGFALHAGALLIVDEGAASVRTSSLTLEWHMHTAADVRVVSDTEAMLTQLHENGTTVHTALAVLNATTDCPGVRISAAEVVNGACTLYSAHSTVHTHTHLRIQASIYLFI